MSVHLNIMYTHMCYCVGLAVGFEVNVCKCVNMCVYFKMEIIDVIV